MGGLLLLAVWTGLEPATPCVTGRYSNQLNYHTIFRALQSLFLDCVAKVAFFIKLTKLFATFFEKKLLFFEERELHASIATCLPKIRKATNILIFRMFKDEQAILS